MSLKRMAALLLLLVLPLLSGCFQQAGEAFKPADGSQTTPLPQGSNPGESNLTSFPATETLPLVITVVEPTSPAIDAATNPPPQDTVIPPPTDAGGNVETPAPTIDQGFSTPNIPLGPLPTDTPNLLITPEAGTATPSGLITPTALGETGSASVSSDGACTHTVQRGDTLFRIANKYNITLAQLREANPQVTSDVIQPGQVLQLPNCNGQASVAPAPTDQTTDATSAAPVPAGGQLYTVKRGDTVYTIARHFGVKMQAIIDANKLTNPDNLKVGQQLIIPTPGS